MIFLCVVLIVGECIWGGVEYWVFIFWVVSYGVLLLVVIFKLVVGLWGD